MVKVPLKQLVLDRSEVAKQQFAVIVACQFVVDLGVTGGM